MVYDTTWRTLGTDHSILVRFGYELWMENWMDWRVARRLRKASDIPDSNGACYDSQDKQIKVLSSLLDMIHKSNDLRKCLLGYDSPRNKTSSYKEQRVSTQKIQDKINYLISWYLGFIYRITSCRDPKKNMLKTRHKRVKTKTWLNKVVG